MILVSKKVKVELTATNATNPVAKAARKVGFSVYRETKKGFSLRVNHSGPGFSISGFFSMMNQVLEKDMLPGDKLFFKPGYNGRYVYSSAEFNGVMYIVEVAAGMIVVTTRNIKKTEKR